MIDELNGGIFIMLEWKDEYSIGIDLIDAQHKHLFEIGNEAHKLLVTDFNLDKTPKVVQIINDLRQYTKYHFKCEEEYMLKTNYKDYNNQKAEHDAFIKKLDSLNIDNMDENFDKHIEDLLAFIFNWILDHILQKDKLIKEE